MAKRRKTLPARTPRDRSRDDDSLLLRSAESLGRVIGALQRQLDEATKRLSPARPATKAAPAATTRSRRTPVAVTANDTKRATRARVSRKTKTTRSRKTTKKR